MSRDTVAVCVTLGSLLVCVSSTSLQAVDRKALESHEIEKVGEYSSGPPTGAAQGAWKIDLLCNRANGDLLYVYRTDPTGEIKIKIRPAGCKGRTTERRAP